MASGDWSQGSTWQKYFLKVGPQRRLASNLGGDPLQIIFSFILLRASRSLQPKWPEDRYGLGAARRGIHAVVCSAGRRA